MSCYNCATWVEKLKSWGVPPDLAYRMSKDLGNMPYQVSQFSSIQEVVPIMEQHGFQSLDWWSDFQQWLQQFMQTLVKIMPGIILTAIGGGIIYFLRNVKVKNIPIGLVGLVPLSYGLWIIAQPFLTPSQPAA